MTLEAAPWLLANEDLLPRRGRALDVACGAGRNALWLAARGLGVLALDRDELRIGSLQAAALARALPIRAEVRDLEAADAVLDAAAFDIVVVVHYLHRPSFPRLLGALAPGGVLVYETFTAAQASRGRPTNPDFLLEPGELRERVASLTLLREREGVYDGRALASVVARREP